jgi:hypothetical protein
MLQENPGAARWMIDAIADVTHEYQEFVHKQQRVPAPVFTRRQQAKLDLFVDEEEKVPSAHHLGKRFRSLVPAKASDQQADKPTKKAKTIMDKPQLITSPMPLEISTKEIPILKIVLNSDNSLVKEQARVTELFKQLYSLEIYAKVHNKRELKLMKLSAENAVKIVKWLFDKTFSKSGLERLRTLYLEVTKDDAWKATSRALQHAEDEGVPLTLRKLYHAYAADSIASTKKSSVLKNIYAFQKKIDFFKQYEACRELLQTKSKNEPLIEFMASQGIVTGVGVSLIGCFHRLVSQQLGIEKRHVGRHVSEGRVICELLNTFGEGILPIMPEGTVSM